MMSLVLKAFLLITLIKCSRQTMKQAVKGQFTHSAFLQIQGRDKSKEYKYNCGASVLSDRWVLTAADCVSNKETPDSITNNMDSYNVTTGATKLMYTFSDHMKRSCGHGQDTDNWVRLTFGVDKIVIHPNWNKTSDRKENNLALLHVRRPIALYRNGPLEIFPISFENKTVIDLDSCYVAGYGCTADGKDETNPFQRRLLYRQLALVKCVKPYTKDLCTFALDDICAEDRGSAVVCLVDKFHYVQMGVVSTEDPNFKVAQAQMQIITPLKGNTCWIKKTMEPNKKHPGC